MSDIIKLLPDTVANQIAAGEVVQRPASVVKELLENAIDAGADEIQLVVTDAGRSLIQVNDNGLGMSATDARMAFERHSTSKIATTEDIFSIHTKGFRGEALASISAVSQVELKTKREDDELGTEIVIHGGNVESQQVVPHSTGTSISVKNLFYNVPARRKFLKSNHVEFRHVIDEFHRVALAHENIAFQLFHNQEEFLRLPSTSLAQRIVDIFGKKLQSQLISVQEETDLISIKGYIVKPEMSRKQRGQQFFFVNQRFFKSGYFHKAVMDAFEGIIPKDHFPGYFLYFDIDPQNIDINIHPSKTEVKFEDEPSLYAIIRSVVKRSIGMFGTLPSFNFDENSQWLDQVPTLPKKQIASAPQIRVSPNYNPFENEKLTYTVPKRDEVEAIYISQDTGEKPRLFQDNNFRSLRLSTGNWIIEHDDSLYVVDVHRMHQSVLYHQLEKQVKGNALSQQLLFPIEIPISGAEVHILHSINPQMTAQGFDMDIGNDMVLISAISAEIDPSIIPVLLQDLLEHFKEHGDEKFEEYFPQQVAAIAAIKRDAVIHSEQLQTIWEKFIQIGMPAYSPQNKTIFTKISTNNLIKELK